jgi:tyrosine-protein kinase
MDLRHYLHILKRQRWLIVSTTVVVAFAAGVFASIQTPKYNASSQVLLRPNDPTEELGASSPAQLDLPRYVAAQAAIVKSLPVARAAAQIMDTQQSAEKLAAQISVNTSETSNVLGITATDKDATRARDIANAYARAYIDNRRDFEVNRLQIAVDAIEGKLETLRGRIDALTAAGAGALGADPVQSTQLDLITSQYTSLLSQQQDLQVEMDLKQGEAEIIAQAVKPGAPATPNVPRDVALGLVVGFLLGVALALAREQLDNRIRSVEDAEESTELMLLGQIPFDATSRRADRHVAVRDDSTGPAAEAVRALRTAVDLHPGRPEVPRIVVTSPGRGDGKTLVAANLAAAFAEAGQRTLLVSADLRHPRLERLFGVARSPGIGDYMLSEDVPAASLVAATDVRNLSLLKAGTAVGNPAAMFMTVEFDELLTEVSQDMDVVLFDSPPVLAVTDATVISAQADAVLLVVAEDGTGRQEAHRSREVLENAGNAMVLGLVVNKVPFATHAFDHYYRPVVR